MLAWLQNLTERERRIVGIGAVVAIILLLLLVILPLERSVARAEDEIARKQADLAWMRNVAPEISAAGPAARSTNQESLLVVVDRAAREAGLGTALTSSEPSGPGGLRVRLERAPFNTVVAWLARLAEQHGIRVEAATIDEAGAPGMVNAGIVLRSQ